MITVYKVVETHCDTYVSYWAYRDKADMRNWRKQVYWRKHVYWPACEVTYAIGKETKWPDMFVFDTLEHARDFVPWGDYPILECTTPKVYREHRYCKEQFLLEPASATV